MKKWKVNSWKNYPVKHIPNYEDEKELNLVLNKLKSGLKIACVKAPKFGEARKNLLYLTRNCWWKDNLQNLYNSGWVYQFNALPANELQRDRAYWMKRIYEELY